MSEHAAYPLSWPHHKPRTAASARKDGKFTVKNAKGWMQPVSIYEARQRLERDLDLLSAHYPVLSTNLELRLDGQPRLGARAPEDPGVALYFRLRDKPIVLACDRYTTVAANIAAIAAHIEATRAIERHGVGTLEEAFAGFTALPAPGKQPWRAVLGFRPDETVTAAMIRAKRIAMAKLHHADAGGSGSRMAEINAAADVALAEIAP